MAQLWLHSYNGIWLFYISIGGSIISFDYENMDLHINFTKIGHEMTDQWMISKFEPMAAILKSLI